MDIGKTEQRQRVETEGRMKDVDYDKPHVTRPVTRQSQRDASQQEFASMGASLNNLGERASNSGHLTESERASIGKKVGQMVRETQEIANSIGEQSAAEKASASSK